MAGEQQAQGETPTGEQAQAADFNFDTWLGEQPEHVRGALDNHTAGLKSALDKERNDRKDLVKELKRLEAAAGQGSEAQKALGEMSSRLEVAEQRAAFYEEAGRPEIGCSNPKAAFLVAQADGLFTKRGDPDWAAIKATAPEFFARKVVPGNAGVGTQITPVAAGGMNEFIRSATGRR